MKVSTIELVKGLRVTKTVTKRRMRLSKCTQNPRNQKLWELRPNKQSSKLKAVQRRAQAALKRSLTKCKEMMTKKKNEPRSLDIYLHFIY